MRCLKSRFPIQIIVFDKLKLIIFVRQGLTLPTASVGAVPVLRNTLKIGTDRNIHRNVRIFHSSLECGLTCLSSKVQNIRFSCLQELKWNKWTLAKHPQVLLVNSCCIYPTPLNQTRNTLSLIHKQGRSFVTGAELCWHGTDFGSRVAYSYYWIKIYIKII